MRDRTLDWVNLLIAALAVFLGNFFSYVVCFMILYFLARCVG